ncbi:MAG: glycosyltransferase family 1 protein [Candidatus Uhrbacteria bacterium]
MRILIDLRCLQAPPPRGGVARYAEGLTRTLLATDTVNDYTLFANGSIRPKVNLPVFDAPNAHWHIGRLPNKVLKGAHMLGIPTPRIDVDVALLTNLDYVPFISHNTRCIVAVHDLSFEHFPEFFSLRQRAWHRVLRPRQLLNRADTILAVSRTTKRDVMETYCIPDEKIHVLYPGLAIPESKTTNANQCPMSGANNHTILGADTPYILALSELSPRKNIDGIVAAFAQLPARYHLVIAGIRGSASPHLQQLVHRSPAHDRIHCVGTVSENEKRALLEHARCFAYPSFWEGFGFPPLDAMAAGVPVVASTSGSLPEILDDAALLVDPLDPNAIARALTIALEDHQTRMTYITRGRARAAEFTWATTVAQLQTILSSLSKN